VYFVGKIRPEVTKYLCEVLPELKGRRFVVGCSGAFTFELAALKYAEPTGLHGNDVSMYSGLIGSLLAAQPFPLRVINDDFEWLTPYISDTLSATATVSLLLQNRYCMGRKNEHQKRLYEEFRAAFEGLHERLHKSIEEDLKGARIDSYAHCDVWEHFQAHADEDAVFGYFAPYYVGGYTTMYRFLESIFDYPHAQFEELTRERNERVFSFLHDRDYIVVFNERREDLQLKFRAPLTRAQYEYLYANVFGRNGHRVRLPRIDPVKARQATLADVFTEDSVLDIHRAPLGQVMFLKQRCVKKVENVVSGTFGYWVTLDRKIIGMVEMSRGRYEPFSVYMLADITLPTRYRRLSKLVLMAVRSNEFWKRLERDFMMRVKHIDTTAWTDQAVSMKYRGPFKLMGRKVDAGGTPFLQYRAEPSGLSLRDTYAEWYGRYGRDIRPDADSVEAG